MKSLYDLRKGLVFKELATTSDSIKEVEANGRAGDFKQILESDPLAKGAMFFMLEESRILRTMHTGEGKIFILTKSILKGLINTNVNIDIKHLQIPFDAILVQFPQIFKPLGYGVQSSYNALSGIYVNKSVQESNTINILLVPENRNTILNGLRIPLDELETTSEACSEKVNEQYIENLFESEKDLLKSHGIEDIESQKGFSVRISSVVKKLVINFLIYITSRDADIIEQFPGQFQPSKKNLKPRSLRREQERHNVKHGSIPYALVGSKVIDPDDEYEHQYGEPISKLSTRFMVSGHWRWQWYGSEHLDNKRKEHIWIKPFWKGPEIARVSNKKKVVI